MGSDDEDMNVDAAFKMDADHDGDDASGDSGVGSDEDDEREGEEKGNAEKLVPMPQSGGIQELREKLHARMAALRRGGGGAHARPGDGEAGSRDELIEERRRHRATLRENRRKETREKKKREEAAKGKKAKEKERNQGPTTKVRSVSHLFDLEELC